MVRVGVVGLGSMGRNHARVYCEMGCLAFVCDVDPSRAVAFGEKYMVPRSCDPKMLLGHVDAVSIVVPTTLHHEVARGFLEVGIPCLVEKPIACDEREAWDLLTVAEQHGVNLAVGHIEHFNPAVVKLKEVIGSGLLGKLLVISTRRDGPFVDRIRDVGVVVDSATHDIGVVGYLFGSEPCQLFARTGRVRANKEDHAVIVLGFGEATACVEVNWFTPHKVRTLTVTGTDGVATLDYIDQTLTVENAGGVQAIPVTKAEPLRLELEDFVQSVEQHRPPRVDGRQGFDILRVALNACKVEVA